MKYYYLLPREEPGVARIAEHCSVEFIDELSYYKEDVVFQLSTNSSAFMLANDLGWPLLSSTAKNIVDSISPEDSSRVWHTVFVYTPEAKYNYYVPEFKESVDILNNSKSIFAEGGFVVKACIDQDKAHGLNIFPVPNSDSRIIISEIIYEAFLKCGIDVSHLEEVSTTRSTTH